jgi:PAS domain S-box-containing protein
MVFGSVPWLLAAGFLGPLPAALVAGEAGLLLGVWETHNLFTPLIYALVAVLFSAMVNQRYETITYRILRHPLVASLGLSLLYPILFLATNPLTIGGPLPVRVDYALSRVNYSTVAFAGQLLVAGIFTEIIALGLPRYWFGLSKLEPSPAQKSLKVRFLYAVIILFLIMLLILIVGYWRAANNSARGMLENQMESTAHMAANSVPFFLETGQSLILQLAEDERLYTKAPEKLVQILEDDLRSVPYFRQLSLLDMNEIPLAGFPEGDFQNLFLTAEERRGIKLAMMGVTFQSYSSVPAVGEDSAQLSFLVALTDENEQPRGVLIGHSGLDSNPFSQPLLENLASVSRNGGEAMLLDSDGMIVYHSTPGLVLTDYTGSMSEVPTFFEETSPDGTRQLVYYHPVEGRSWAVVTKMPVRYTQQLALDIMVPLLATLVPLLLIVLFIIFLGLRVITSSLSKLAIESQRIAEGNLNRALNINGADEVGKLGQAFEQMRKRLKARLDEINLLLGVSQGVASSLDMEDAIVPILEAALTPGASSSRLVLEPSTLPGIEDDKPTRFGLGPSTNLYGGLDNQVLALTKQQDSVVLSNPARARLGFEDGRRSPSSLMAMALKHEKRNYGALWVAYDSPYHFSEEEVRFVTTVAGHAALAAANAYLFKDAQIGRQRLQAILESSPDPVLVTDHKDRILMTNPAAVRLLGKEITQTGAPVEQVVSQPELLDLLKTPNVETQSAEINFPEKKAYYVTTSHMSVEGQPMGRVCVLRDITHFKELDALKNEFVSTVSHDLRSPLTLIRGYITMLDMVGDLNEQQTSYVSKIVIGIEHMSNMVSSLLDLSRIEMGIGVKAEQLSVEESVQKVFDTLQMLAAQNRVDLHLEPVEEGFELIEADPELLQRAIHNLVENGIKYTGPKGKVWVEISQDVDTVTIAINDTGIGIARVDQPRLFEPFFRAVQRETRKKRGSGLGLTIVKSIAEKHNGRVWVESQLGKGSVFYFQIPKKNQLGE